MRRLITGCICLLAGLLLIGGSLLREFPVYDADLPVDQIALFEALSEYQLVAESTFAGVRVSETTHRLITTYDRTQLTGRPACPT